MLSAVHCPPLLRAGTTRWDRARAGAAGWPLVEEVPRVGLYLLRQQGALQLASAEGNVRHLLVDFLGPRWRGASRRDPLARAIGLHKRHPRILDATAGLGRDALAMARLGGTVVAVEWHPVLFALLADGVGRLLRAAGPVLEGSIRLIEGDSVAVLGRERADVVYLDPMFEGHGKAGVRWEAQWLRRLMPAGAQDVEALFAAALERAGERVVVKRHHHLPPLGPDPSHQVHGRAVRFDVYLREPKARAQ